jgi:hypothetical protein
MGGGSKAPDPIPPPPPPKQMEEGPQNAAEAERLRRLLAIGRSSTSVAGSNTMSSLSTMG